MKIKSRKVKKNIRTPVWHHVTFNYNSTVLTKPVVFQTWDGTIIGTVDDNGDAVYEEEKKPQSK